MTGGAVSGDVHHSHVLKGDLSNTNRPGSVWHFTVSPFRRGVDQDSQELLRSLDSGKLPYRADLALKLEKPSFVDDQFDRLDWYPLTRSGRRTSYGNVDAWDFFGKFVGIMDLDATSVTYRYLQAREGQGAAPLEELLAGTVPVY